MRKRGGKEGMRERGGMEVGRKGRGGRGGAESYWEWARERSVCTDASGRFSEVCKET